MRALALSTAICTLTTSAALAQAVNLDCPNGATVMMEAVFHDGGLINTLMPPRTTAAVCVEANIYTIILDLGWGTGNPRFDNIEGVEAFIDALHTYGAAGHTVAPES